MPQQAIASEIPGHAFGSPGLARSPVTLDDLEALKRTIGFGEEDHRALRTAWEVLQDRIDEVLLRATVRGQGHSHHLPEHAAPGGALAHRALRVRRRHGHRHPPLHRAGGGEAPAVVRLKKAATALTQVA